MSFISFDEIFLIIIISLVILGPKKTLGMAFYLGSLFGKVKRYLNEIKSELDLGELKQNTLYSANSLDFHSTPISNPKGKRLWTVNEDDFKSESDYISNSLKKTDDSNQKLLSRLEKLEKEVSELEKKIEKS